MLKLKELRKIQNLTQEKLARKIGVSRSTVAMWEVEENAPDLAMAKKLADLFCVSVDYLLGRDVPQNKKLADNTVSIIARGGESIEAELSDEQAEMMINFIKSLKEQNKGRNIDKKRE